MTLTETFVAIAPPLRIDSDGAIRVGKCRVTLEVLLESYKGGASAEEIASAFDTLELADIHAVISYYLRNRATVDAHLEEVKAHAEACRKVAEADPHYQAAVEQMRRRYAERQEQAK